ncbi:transferase [Clostridia bacterium]|nr:transferase [Clostridia bacterium]
MLLKETVLAIKWFPAGLLNVLLLKLRRANIGTNFISYGLIFIRGTGSIVIGDNVTINSCRETNPIGGDCKTIMHIKEGGSLRIGNGVGISNTTLVSTDNITIEDYVLVGGSTKIYDNDFHSIHYQKRISPNDTDIRHAPVVIRSGAFIGAHCIILKGVTIGEKSIVGAGSVVTHSIPAGEVWAGNPAKFVKKIGGV